MVEQEKKPSRERRVRATPSSYKYGMSNPSSAFVARVWEVVEEKAGFELGQKTKNVLSDRIKELYLMHLKSDVVGDIIHHEWRLHSRLSRQVRELREELEKQDSQRPRASVTIVRQKTEPAIKEARQVVDEDLEPLTPEK